MDMLYLVPGIITLMDTLYDKLTVKTYRLSNNKIIHERPHMFVLIHEQTSTNIHALVRNCSLKECKIIPKH